MWRKLSQTCYEASHVNYIYDVCLTFTELRINILKVIGNVKVIGRIKVLVVIPPCLYTGRSKYISTKKEDMYSD